MNTAKARGYAATITFAAAIFSCQPKQNTRPATEVIRRTDPPQIGSFGIDLTARSLSTSPGDDFYQYANGAWLKSYQLKPDEMRYGSFIKLRYLSEDRVQKLIDEMAARQGAQGSIEQKLGDYFASFMDVQKLNKLGIKPLAPELARIRAIDSRARLIEAFGRASMNETNAPIVFVLDIDRKNPDRYMLNMMHAGLGLPDRSYYLEHSSQFKEVRAAYKAHIATMLRFSGISPSDAKTAADKILALEVAIATHHWPRAQLRDVDKTYNVRTLAELEAEHPSYPWQQHLKAARIHPADVEAVNIVPPNAIAPLAQLVNRVPLSTWKHYLAYHLIKNHAMLLGDRIDNANFAFYGTVLNGQPEQRDRWKRGISLIGDMRGLGEAIGQVYVARYFPPASKLQMERLVEHLRAAFRQRLAAIDWMGDETKKEAFAKLQTFRPKIGYPEKWRDFSAVKISRDDLMANYRAVRDYWYEDMLSRLTKATDKDEWFMTPQTVNAYYNPSFNEIVFPAAILQPPFFDPKADAAVNYGAIGAVIGHEMGHGFDDQGSKSDAAGIQRNWWTDEDRARFEARTKKLITQYSKYEALDGHTVNGELTLGENIGDLGGLAIAYHAYKLSLAGQEAHIIDGLSGDQRFFLSWAQVWRAKYRDQFLLKVIKSDPHSPAPFRVNGVVRNIDAWYPAFGIGADNALYLAPAKRVHIW